MTEQTNATLRRDRSTIEDVAVAAGVSVATVSRALRGLPNVAESTRLRVQEIAVELDYHANPAASRLATGRSRSVAVAVPYLYGWYFSHVVAGAEAVLAESGYDTMVIGLSDKGSSLDLLDGSNAVHRRADGLILVDIAPSEEDLRALQTRGLEIVSVGPALESIASVGIDDVAVGELATEYLIGLGHRRIGLIRSAWTNPSDFIVPRRRRQGFEQAHANHDLPVDPGLSADGNFTIQGGYESTEILLDRDDPPTALFALSDEMAFGAIQAVHDRGLSVPGDISIVGVDDHDVAALLGLTTIHQDVDQHGARAARLLVDRLAGGTAPRTRHNDPIRLIERSSSAPPPR